MSLSVALFIEQPPLSVPSCRTVQTLPGFPGPGERPTGRYILSHRYVSFPRPTPREVGGTEKFLGKREVGGPPEHVHSRGPGSGNGLWVVTRGTKVDGHLGSKMRWEREPEVSHAAIQARRGAHPCLAVMQDGVQTCGPCVSCFRQHRPPGAQADQPSSAETPLWPVIRKWGFLLS